MSERTAICDHCGDEYQQIARQRRSYCKKLACFRAAERQRTTQYRMGPKPPPKPRGPRPMEPVECSHCGETYLRGKGAPVGELGLFCSADQCRKAMNRLKMRLYAARKRAEGVDIFAPHRAKAAAKLKARIAAGEELPQRQRYPSAARRGDALRSARKRGAKTGEIFTNGEIFLRDDWICGLCGEPVNEDLAWPHPMSKSLDHIIPLSRGGLHARANVQLAHLDCNVRKNARMPA